ncbi:MAG: hypothetical protein NWR43_04250 [Alphaproteobacteria bacterium]|nr:hypothetical protein [Alphaproteobacteria bacterium]
MGENKENACGKCVPKIFKIIVAPILIIPLLILIIFSSCLLKILTGFELIPEYLSQYLGKEDLINEIEVSLAFLANPNIV